LLAYVAFHSSIFERSARAENAKIHLHNYDAKKHWAILSALEMPSLDFRVIYINGQYNYVFSLTPTP